MLVATVDSTCAPASRSGGCRLHQLTSERIKRQLLYAPHGITQSGNRQRHPKARRKAQPARSCPPSSSQRSTSLAVSPSSWERSTSGRSATSASVRSSGTCSVMLSPAPDVYSCTMNMLPLLDRGPGSVGRRCGQSEGRTPCVGVTEANPPMAERADLQTATPIGVGGGNGRGAALLRVAECAGCGLVGVVAANRRGSLRLRSWLCDRNVEKEPEWKHMRWRRQGQRSAGRVTASRRWCRGWAARSRRGAPTRNWRHDC